MYKKINITPEVKAKEFLNKIQHVRIGSDKYFGYVVMQLALEELFKEESKKS